MAKKRDKAAVKDRYDRLKERMQDIDTGFDSDFWKPRGGRNVVRILPAVGDMEFFFQEVGRHYGLPGGDNIACPAMTTQGEEPCPICELVQSIRGGNEADKALASQLRVRKQYWMNVIVREDSDDKGDTGDGPYVYTPGPMVFKSLQAMVLNPDYGDIADEYSGVDVVIEKSGEGRDTEYEVQGRRRDTPLHVDDEQIDEWMDAALDLSYVMLSDDPDEDNEIEGIVKVMPYDRIIEEFGLEPGIDTDELMEELEIEEPAPARASTKKSKTRKGADAEDEVGAELRRRSKRRR